MPIANVLNRFKEDGVMENEKRCVYCGNVIKTTSKEHIIQNAIGGLCVSGDICCPTCNACLSKSIDRPFAQIFVPITSKIKNFVKSHNTKSCPSYTGQAMTGQEVYDVVIKDNMVVSAPMFSQVYHCEASKAEWTIFSSYFNLDNDSYKNGLSKIAFNFALKQDVSIELLKDKLGIKTVNDKVTDIKFRFPVMPFVALNPLDDFIELNTPLLLYHNLILFNENNQLWCYIDLFNTFQVYVLLSEKWDSKIDIYRSYLQLLQQIDRTMPVLNSLDLKDISILSAQYGVQPTTDMEIFRKSIADAVQKRSLVNNMEDVISSKLNNDNFLIKMKKTLTPSENAFCLESLCFYFDEDDRLRTGCYRKVTLTSGKYLEVASYPQLINKLYAEGTIKINDYTRAKFNRLVKYLNGEKNEM